ncbi:MAG: NADPH-dependent F420 reductase [Pseudomonadota bacterium]
MEENARPTIAIVGGTGDLGSGLARRWVKAGYRVLIGSRSEESAQAAAATLEEQARDADWPQCEVEGLANVDAAARGDVVVVTVPFGSQKDTLLSIASEVQGKTVVDVTVPLVPPKVARVQMPDEGSAGQIAQSVLGEEVHVVSAFQNVAAAHLQTDDPIACDVLVCGNKKDARQQVIDLMHEIGMRGVHAGLINNAAAAEALTSVLINLNRQYKTHTGIRITGID